MPDPTPAYRLSLWDTDGQRWAEESGGLPLWRLRGALREAYARGYHKVSILVEREDDRGRVAGE